VVAPGKSGTFRGASAGQQGDEGLGVGDTPAGDRVPAGSGLVAVIVTGGEVEVKTTVLLPVLMSWNALWYSGPRAIR
jgi:hypothetical protein